MSLALLKNSAEAQFEEVESAFTAIRKKAREYERQEKGAIAKLYATLADLYDFGEKTRNIFDKKQRSLTQQFIEHGNGKWSKPVRGNGSRWASAVIAGRSGRGAELENCARFSGWFWPIR